jgi:amino-acid N-acetyltransferase
MKLRPATCRELPAVRQLLAGAGLPDDDIDGHLATLIVGVRGGTVSACGALELLGQAALLRSVAVSPLLRGRGWGRRITTRLLDMAAGIGVREVYLLTTGAAEYFSALGFEKVPRESAPPPLQRTRQFGGLCPETAVLMKGRAPL